MANLTYQQALDYLYGFVDYSVERSYRYSPDVFDLARVHQLLADLGHPHRTWPSFHVAGTKGKGSTSSFIASVLRAAGYRTGLYTSPHLIHFTERIQVDGRSIREEELAALVERVQPAVAATTGLTMYEVVTAIAFLYFADQGVQAAVVEVGLGGRLDATNVLQPLVSVITSLSYDHTHLLGERLSDIAREKAGIIKAGVPVVLAPQQQEAEHVVERIAHERGSDVILVGRDWLFAPGTHDLSRQSLYIWTAWEQTMMDRFVDSGGGEEWAPPRYEIPLLGHHQVINASVAYAALKAGAERGLAVNDAAIRKGFLSVEWPGRFQVLSRSPIVVVDSAHNRDSALKLRLALDDYFPDKRVTLIFGASADKDLAGMFDELLPRVSRLIVTQAAHPRAADPADLTRLAHTHGVRVETVLPVDQALRHALDTQQADEVILAAGSLFVAGEILHAWSLLRPSAAAEQGVGR
jgi:dihydrofolate synthase/folylpolyglutamate synthase